MVPDTVLTTAYLRDFSAGMFHSIKLITRRVGLMGNMKSLLLGPTLHTDVYSGGS